MLKKIFLLVSIFGFGVNAQDFWERTTPYAGTLNKLYFLGNDTVYGTLNSGFTRSTDNGNTWTTPIIVNYVTDMAVAPNGNIYLSENQKKMSRSTNKGNSWTVVGGKGMTETSCAAVIVTAQGTILGGTEGGIYRSTDEGENWQKVAGLNELGADSSISAMATYNGVTLYAFTRIYSGGDRSYAVRSTDDGVTWTKATQALDSVSIYEAVIAPNNTIFAKTGNGLRISNDGGNSWNVAQFYGNYILDCFVANNGNIFVVLNNDEPLLYKSTDNGVTWATIEIPFAEKSSLGINNAGDIFVGLDQMYRSKDGGATWKELPITYPQIGKMIESPKHELYFNAGGTAYQKLYRSTDFGSSWKPMNTPVVGVPIVAFYAETLLVADNYYVAKLYRSTDDGKSFDQISKINVLSGYVNSLLATSVPSIIAGTSNGIYVSIDHGKNWTKTSSSPISSLQQTSDGTIFGFREFYGAGVLRSTDNGNSWQELKSGMSNTIVHSVSVAPNGNIFSATDGGLYRSTDKGDNWVRIDTQKIKPYGIYATINKSGILFFGGAKNGTNSNSSRSTDYGATWEQLDNMSSIDNQASIKGLFASSDGRIFSATNLGLFRSKTIPTSVAYSTTALPVEFELQQNYPNPFNPSTTITFSISKNAAGLPVSLKVYDILGKEVATLVHEQLQSGTYSIQFNGYGFSSGVYFYTLKSGYSTQTQKMVYLP